MSHTRHARSHRRSPTSGADLGLVLFGLVMAVASGVTAYRVVGPYGDGALNVGLGRTQDPETGVQLVYRDVPTAGGTVLRYLFDDTNRTLVQTQVISVANGVPVTVGVRTGDNSTKTGFSLGRNGVIDAWEYRDGKGRLLKIEVSRRQDGKVDRWEYYENDQLARVEEDENRDGKADRTLIYDAGILVSDTRDKKRIP